MSKSPYDLMQEQLQLVKECQEFEGELNNWETTFLEGIRGRLQRNVPLTVNQENVLMDLKKKLIERLD